MKQSITFAGGAILMAVLVVLAGCSQPKVVQPTGPRPPGNPAQVKFYGKQPATYEDLGLITLAITPGLGWDERGNANAAFELLRERAAAKGANGVLFMVPAEEFRLYATAGYNGTFYQVPMRNDPRTAVAKAIFVIKE